VYAAVGSLACWLGLAYAHSAYWEFWVWCAVFGLTVVTIWGTAYWLVAASTRHDNTAITFGVQNVVVYLFGAFATAAVFDAIRPGASGYTTQASWVYLLLGASAFVLAVAVIWLFLAPRMVRDQHALVRDSKEDDLLPETPPPGL
jgi:hypothetical protein